MNIKDGTTSSIRDKALRSEEIDDVREIITQYSESYLDWKRFINDLLAFYGYNMNKLATICGFSRNTVKKWCDNGDLPRSRKEFIKLGFGIGMSLDEINDLLQRYGKYPKLYAKNIEDAVYIFSLSHNKDFEYAVGLKEKLLAYFGMTEPNNVSDMKMTENTERFQQKIKDLNKEEELLEFIRQYQIIFSNVYTNLVNYIDEYIKPNTADYVNLSKNYSLNYFLSGKFENEKLVNIYNDMISSLKNKKEIPSKLKLIALGVNLNMSVDEIDKMLELAGMESLCAKDRVECALIYAIENFMLNESGEMVDNLYMLGKESTDIAVKENCYKIIKKYEHTEKASDYTVEDVNEYIIRTLRELDINEAKNFIDLLK